MTGNVDTATIWDSRNVARETKQESSLRGSNTGEKKNHFILKKRSDIFHDIENTKDKMLESDSYLERSVTIC